VNIRVRIAEALYRRRVLSIVILLGGALLFVPRIDPTKIDNDLGAWISKQDRVYRQYDYFRREFGGTRTLIIALEGEGIFTPAGLRYLDRISSELMKVRLAERVQSLATASVVRALPIDESAQSGIEVVSLFDGGIAAQADADRVKAEALDDPLLERDLLSENARVVAVVVTFDEDRIDAERGQALADARAVVERDRPPGITVHYNGSLEVSEEYNRITVANAQSLTAPILAITLLSLYWMFRSLRKALAMIIAVAVSVIWTLGLYSILGFSFNILTSMLTPLVVVLAIADDVHIVQHFDAQVRATGDKKHAFTSTFDHLLVPLLAAAGTTALGMLALATSNIVAVRTFGIAAAIGVMIDVVVSLVFVPAALTVLRPDDKAPRQEKWLMAPLQRAGNFAFTHSGLILVTAGAVLALSAVGLTRLRVDTNHTNFFDPSHPFSRSADIVDRELAGVYSFNILLEGPPDTLTAPDILHRIEELSTKLRGLPYVRKVSSVADYVKRVNQQLAGGASEHYRLPATSDAIAQELFVFGLSEEGRQELSRVITSDYSRAHIAVKMASLRSDLVFEQINTAERLAADAFAGTAVTPTVTGSGRLFATLDHYLVISQLSSFATAFVTVFIVIFLVFRSTTYGLVGIVANTVPVITVLGFMGWLGISLNVATVMVASVALGIVDDDTIHFISRFRRELSAGRSTRTAIELAAMHEGRAALTSTVINAAGFAVLLLSDYRPTAWFGWLMATTMILAFITEVFIVPAIIARMPHLFPEPAPPRSPLATA
jgi:predicted RND superfamily exporter protein